MSRVGQCHTHKNIEEYQYNLESQGQKINKLLNNLLIDPLLPIIGLPNLQMKPAVQSPVQFPLGSTCNVLGLQAPKHIGSRESWMTAVYQEMIQFSMTRRHVAHVALAKGLLDFPGCCKQGLFYCYPWYDHFPWNDHALPSPK